MSQSPSLLQSEDKVFNVQTTDWTPSYRSQLPSYLRKSVAMTCGPPGSLPVHKRVSLSVPSMSTPSKSERSSSRKEIPIRITSAQLNVDWRRKVELEALHEFLTTVKSITLSEDDSASEKDDEHEDGKVDYDNLENVVAMATAEKGSTKSGMPEKSVQEEQVLPSQKAADMLTQTILHHQPISMDDLAFLIDQIDLCIYLDMNSTAQTLELLIKKNDIVAAYSEPARQCLQKEANKNGGKLSFGTLKRIVGHFASLSKKIKQADQ
uniref:Uncharacterized protein n=1 Tax=Trichuris muris TaxID=70415 RepID=A0A5S6QXB9_TRIMR